MRTKLNKPSYPLFQMLCGQIQTLNDSELALLWEEHFPDPEKREYYEELGRMFPSFMSRMMGMDIHGMIRATYTCECVAPEFEFHTFTLVCGDDAVCKITDVSLDAAWKRIYIIATEYVELMCQ